MLASLEFKALPSGSFPSTSSSLLKFTYPYLLLLLSGVPAGFLLLGRLFSGCPLFSLLSLSVVPLPPSF